METKIDNYKATIKSFIKQGKVEEAMEAVDTLAAHTLHIGMQYTENCNQNNPENDMVNNPSHYQSMVADLNIDCITAMRAAFGNYETAVFCKLNAFKYVWRASSKNGNEDIDKASWYLNKFKELGGENQ